jgi:hypothetical protein
MAVLAHYQGPVVVTALRVVVPSLDERNGGYIGETISVASVSLETLQGVGSWPHSGRLALRSEWDGGVVPPRQPAQASWL